MKDLDFDELDKAVNSLMGGVKEKDPGDASKTLDISSTLAPDEKPAYGTLRHVAERIGSEAIDKQEQTVSLGSELSSTPLPAALPTESKRVSVPARQKAGRFMDVVHPSSDMKKPGSQKSVSREGATIDAPVVESAPESPLSVETDAPLSDTAGNLPASSTPVEPDNVEVKSEPPVVEPLISPFLPDTKVEKRPLGGEPATTSTTPDEPGLKSDREPALLFDPSAPKDETTSNIQIEAPPVSDESSVMDNLTDPAKADEDVAMHIPEEYKDELLAVEKSSDVVPVSEPKDIDHATKPELLAVASIPKQYQEKLSSGESKNGAIYDTDTYHKPLSHPAKKSSGWLWVIAIVVIIALGAGAGAFVYFMGL